LLAEIDLAAWTAPAVFGWLSGAGGVTEGEMLRTFNCGIGLIAVVDEESARDCIASFAEAGDQARVIGFLTSASGNCRVRYRGTGLFA
jgi:phosphoribosylformylglycinamidine cyclo-ligase